MASIVSPKNVGKLIIADALATETTNSTFNATASVNEVAIIKANGAAAEAGKPFKIIVKKDTSLTGVDFSDTIDPKQIDYVKAVAYEAEVPKIITVSGFSGTVKANATYRVSIRKYDHIQSPENFRHVHGFVVTKVGNTLTYSDVLNQLRDNLNTALAKENASKEIVVSVSGTTLVFTGQVQGFYLGKGFGDVVDFDVEVSVKDNSPATLAEAGTSYDILTVATTQGAKEGKGTGKQIALAEYSLKGYENGDYSREVGFPNNFNVDYQADKNGTYNTVIIGFHKDRDGVNVERQFKEVSVVFNEDAVSTVTDAFLAELRDVTEISETELPDLGVGV